MRDRPDWHGRPTRLPDGKWGVLIQHFPATLLPRPGDTVEVHTRRRGRWLARITAVEDTRRQTLVRTTGPDEGIEQEGVRDSEPPQSAVSAEDDPLGILREAAETLRAAAEALGAAQRGGEQAYLELLKALYRAEDEKGRDLVEAHQILRLSLVSRNASDHALYGAARLLEAATDTLSGAKDLLQEICWLDEFGEVKAAGNLRTAVARMNTAGLLQTAGDALHEATTLLGTPNNPNAADLANEHREEIRGLREICAALKQVLLQCPDERS